MIVPATGENIKKAAQIIVSGGLVGFPTETVYGLGANALDPIAVAKVFEAKARPRLDPLIVHVSSVAMARRVAYGEHEAAQILMQAFWPGPLTLILPKTSIVPDIVTAGFKTVAVRMPGHPVALELVRAAQVPIAAPSANAFGKLSPTTALHVEEQLGSALPLILDGGASSIGVESTIIDLTRSVPTIVRAGGLAIEDVEKHIGKVAIDLSVHQRPDAPGRLKHHYAPRNAKLVLLDHAWPDERIVLENGKRYALLAFRKPSDMMRFDAVRILSASGSLAQAAANLFEQLHVLDSAHVDVILAEPVPEIGLGRAIMDRLRRGAANDD